MHKDSLWITSCTPVREASWRHVCHGYGMTVSRSGCDGIQASDDVLRVPNGRSAWQRDHHA